MVASLNVPVAVNAWVRPAGRLGPVGATAIDTSAALVTVSDAPPFAPSSVAVIRAMPGEIPVATPREPAAFDTCATAGTVDAQVT